MALSGPPWTDRSACSSPSMLTPRTATRPSTGAFQIAVSTVRPPVSTRRGRPTLTLRTRPMSALPRVVGEDLLDVASRERGVGRVVLEVPDERDQRLPQRPAAAARPCAGVGVELRPEAVPARAREERPGD